MAKRRAAEFCARVFTTTTEVEKYFGVGSVEAGEAKFWFANHPGSTMNFTRDRLGQRPHDLSGNIANLSVKQLQAISGTLSVSWNGWTYSGSIDQSNILSTMTQGQAANQTVHNVAMALNRHRPTLATAMVTITPKP